MKTYADLIFAPIANALLAGLASRAHQWSEWEMLQVFQAELSPAPEKRLQIIERSLWLRIVLKGPSHGIYETRIPWQASASGVLAEAFSPKLSPPQGTHFPPLPRELKELDEVLSEDSWDRAEDWALGALGSVTTNQTLRASDIRYRNYLGKSAIVKTL